MQAQITALQEQIIATAKSNETQIDVNNILISIENIKQRDESKEVFKLLIKLFAKLLEMLIFKKKSK